MTAEIIATGRHAKALSPHYATDLLPDLADGTPVLTTIGWTVIASQTSALLEAIGAPPALGPLGHHLALTDIASIDFPRIAEIGLASACPGLETRLQALLAAGFDIWIRAD